MNRQAVLLVDGDGAPAQVALQMRESETAPGRLKVAFTASGETGLGVHDPETGATQNMAPKGSEGEAVLCPEFRLEMN